MSKRELREAIREEWFTLHLLDSNKKTSAVRYRMRTLYNQFLEVR